MQTRFKQEPLKNNETQPRNKSKSERTFKLDKDVFKFFYNAFSSHVYDQTQTFGDIYRLFKYFFQF